MSVAGRLDAMPEDDAREALARCCGARRWVDGMLARRPFHSDDALHRAADDVWREMQRDDVLEAFSCHPRIGAAAAAGSWSSSEQASIVSASERTLRELRDSNARYEERFGHVFLVCATGKSAVEMLALLRDRMSNAAARELEVAAAEQAKITHIRLEKL